MCKDYVLNTIQQVPHSFMFFQPSLLGLTGLLALLGVIAVAVQTANQQSSIDDFSSRISSLESDQTNICSTVMATIIIHIYLYTIYNNRQHHASYILHYHFYLGEICDWHFWSNCDHSKSAGTLGCTNCSQRSNLLIAKEYQICIAN